MLKRLASHFYIGAMLLTLGACSDPEALQVSTAENNPPNIGASTPSDTSQEQQVQFDFAFSALFGNDDDSQLGRAKSRQILQFDQYNMKGTVTAENLETGEITNSSISIFMNNFSANSHSTLLFKPGQYDLTFTFTKEGKYYMGQLPFFDVFEDNNNIAPVTLTPVIGDTTIDVQASTLINLVFEIPLEDLNAANLADPVLEIAINGNINAFFIDPITGQSPDMWLNLEPGTHEIEASLYNVGWIVARTPLAMRQVEVVVGDVVTLPLAPMVGEVGFDVFVESGIADVSVSVPADVINVAGGIGNLDAHLHIAEVGGGQYHNEILSLTPNGDNYTTNVTIPDVTYGLKVIDIVFHKIDTGELLGSCFQEEAFTSSDLTVTCQIQLQSESSATTSLLSSVGINVLDAQGYPLPGALVSVDGEAVGMTGNNPNSAPGFTSVLLPPGVHILSAEFNGELGEIEYDSQALGAENVLIVLGETINNNPPLFDKQFDDPDQFPSYFWWTCASGSGYPTSLVDTDEDHLALVSSNGPGDCVENGVVTVDNFMQPEIDIAGGFEVDLDLTGAIDTGVELSVGIGEDQVADPLLHSPANSADAVVTVRDSEVEINIYDAGVLLQTVTRSTPFLLNQIDSFEVDVELTSFFPGDPGIVSVVINGNPSLIEPVQFDWDGGENHIELRAGGATQPNQILKLFVDRMVVRPR